MPKKAIYLSGGGARGAYQAGVLKGIADIIQAKSIPVDILSSVSAGAINAAFIAMHANDFTFAVSKLVELWSSLSCGKIFRTGNLALIKSVIRNMSSMMFHHKARGGGYLLDTTPLRALLDANLDFKNINDNIENGLLSAFEVAATCYDLSENTSFFKSSDPLPCWKRRRHTACSTNITCQHILASSAMPLFFPAIKIDQWHYGDGGVRLTAPLRAPIKLGADQILVIGTRKMAPIESAISSSNSEDISFAKVLGNMLNALFSDNLDRDIDLLTKINHSIRLVPPEKQKESKWRPIKVLYIYPSIDLAECTSEMQNTLPILLRYLMSAFGSKEQSGDLLSFLLFEADYCKDLINIGYNDAMAQENEIKDFFQIGPVLRFV